MTTTERKKQIKSNVDYEIGKSKNREKEELIIKNLLEEGGWIEGEHFVYDGVWKEVETTVKSGDYYNNTNRSHKVKITLFGGGCKPIMVKKDENNQPIKRPIGYSGFRLNTQTRGYSLRKYKPTLTSSSITDNYRRYSAKKLLEELIWKNERDIRIINDENAKKDLYEVVFNHYVGKYINDKVEKTTIYGRYTSYKGIKITFENGNYVELILGSELGRESVHKKFDAKLEAMKDIDEIAKYLNK